MKRTIKFKAKDYKDVWVYGTYYLGVMYPTAFKGHYVGDTQIDESTLCQFTGLTDKNGKEVFEGDEIRVNDKNQYGKVKKLKYIVEFIEGCFMCVLNESEYETVFPKSMKNQPNMKLTGRNIHDK